MYYITDFAPAEKKKPSGFAAWEPRRYESVHLPAAIAALSCRLRL